jgi:hypothetical protein
MSSSVFVTSLREALSAGRPTALPDRTGKPSALYLWSSPVVVGPATRVRELDWIALRDDLGFVSSTKLCDELPLRRTRAKITVYDLRVGRVVGTRDFVAPDTCSQTIYKDPDGTPFSNQVPDDAQVIAYLAALKR